MVDLVMNIHPYEGFVFLLACSIFRESLSAAFLKFHDEHPAHAAAWTLSVNSHSENPFLQITAYTIATESVKGMKKKKAYVFHLDFAGAHIAADVKKLSELFHRDKRLIAFTRKRYTTVVSAAIEFLGTVGIIPALVLADTAELGVIRDDFAMTAMPMEHFSRDFFKYLFGSIFTTALPAVNGIQTPFFINFFGEILHIAMTEVPALNMLMDNNTVKLFSVGHRQNHRFNRDIFSEISERQVLEAVKALVPVEHEYVWRGLPRSKVPGMMVIIRKTFRLMRTLWERQTITNDDELEANSIVLKKCFDEVDEIMSSCIIRHRLQVDDPGRTFRAQVSTNCSADFLHTINTYTQFINNFPRATFDSFSLHYEYEFATFASPITYQDIASRLANGKEYYELTVFRGDPIPRFLSLWCGWSMMFVEYVKIFKDKKAVTEFLEHAQGKEPSYIDAFITAYLKQQESNKKKKKQN